MTNFSLQGVKVLPYPVLGLGHMKRRELLYLRIFATLNIVGISSEKLICPV
jgi:hypothetical protein